MGDAKLHGDAEVFHVLVIGGEVIAAQNAVELLAQHVENELSDRGKGDVIDRLHIGHQRGEALLEKAFLDL